MTSVVERRAADPDAVLVVCDFTPPRGADTDALMAAGTLDADWISVAYNPGKATRVNAVAAARWIADHTGRDAIFTLGTRDMNRLATQSLLLGAQLLGLENVVVVRGDGFTARERESVKPVHDFTPTALLRSITEMNAGVDFRGSKLQAPTALCAGATIDLGRDHDAEVALTVRKAEAGARFFLTQPLYDPGTLERLLDDYARAAGVTLDAPVFAGVQVMTGESLRFGEVPADVIADLDRGRPGEEIALAVLDRFVARGFRSIYLVPPIMRGGRRDYAAAARVLTTLRAR
ncbi:MAG: methylenetetrahydrofolate reductase [Chloroflexi bacterium]|nr:methylenetetrahydrofolate reductase [Chloroflexota bacterium]